MVLRRLTMGGSCGAVAVRAWQLPVGESSLLGGLLGPHGWLARELGMVGARTLASEEERDLLWVHAGALHSVVVGTRLGGGGHQLKRGKRGRLLGVTRAGTLLSALVPSHIDTCLGAMPIFPFLCDPCLSVFHVF